MRDTNSLGPAIVLAAALLSAAVMWHAEGQRYTLAGDGNLAIRLDRRTGETVVCVRRSAMIQGAAGMVAPCDGSRR